MKIKICKSCDAENSPENSPGLVECHNCMANISGISPVEKNENVKKTVQDRSVCDRLILVSISAARNGDVLPVNDGDILGREHVGKDLFSPFGTVGRRHAKITFWDGEWTIEDLDSMNGTYINGSRLDAGKKYPLKAKNTVALSKSCEFLVEIGGIKI